AFLGSMGSPYFAATGYASRLTVTQVRICLHPLATRLHQYYHSLAGLPSCVTPSLDYYRHGSHAPTDRILRRKPHRGGWLAVTGLARDASTRAREYQPVVHRLRLSASP